LAPLLLDGAGYVTTWLNQDQYLAVYDEDDEKSKKQKGFLAHLEALKALYRDTHNGRVVALGKKPDDLIEVLTDMAIASPAVCIYRTYKKYAKSFAHYLPSQIAKLFLNRMNSPEATAIVKLAAGRKNDDAHWENLLTYCKYGNIQAMFDEYAHLITNGLDKDERLIDRLHYTIADSMNVRTTSYNVDTLNNFKSRVTGKKEKAVSLRTHFAVAFTKGDGKEKGAQKRFVGKRLLVVVQTDKGGKAQGLKTEKGEIDSLQKRPHKADAKGKKSRHQKQRRKHTHRAQLARISDGF
jgi:hypothetical protein